MPEDFDLRGTQGAVVLPHGTVVQNYQPPTTEPDMTQSMTTNGDKALYDRVYKHEGELADVRARMAIMEALIGEMKAPLAQIPEIKALLEHVVKPKQAPVNEMAPATMAWFALLAVLAISVIVGLIFVGGGGLGGG